MTEQRGNTQPLGRPEGYTDNQILTFSLKDGRQFGVGKKITRRENGTDSVRLSVCQIGSAIESAYLTGFWRESNGRVAYQEIGMENETRTEDVTGIPGLVKQTVKELILQDKVNTWYSSDTLSAGGKKLYASLYKESKRPESGFAVTRERTWFGIPVGGRFIITRK